MCNENFNVEVLKIYYQYYHSINENNYFFREIFPPDNNSKRCDECQIEFKNNRKKKNHFFKKIIFCFIDINRQEVPLTRSYR